ncbi:MAG TPA: HAMP domain-containing sensor histidine kinase [Vicinamibacterales bacterium]|jgi:signal transduction histidine kinase
MAPGPTEPAADPKWPKLLSHVVHELRSPLTVVAGYVHMLLKERAGPVSDQQRRLLEEADKSCAKLSEIVKQISAVSRLEAGKTVFRRSPVDLGALLAEVIAFLPELRDRAVAVELDIDSVGPVQADATLLKDALAAIVVALRREVVGSDLMKVRAESGSIEGNPAVRITVGEADRMPRLLALSAQELGPFDEWRGGDGLSLTNARRVIEAHGGTLLSPIDDGRAGAIVSIPSV